MGAVPQVSRVLNDLSGRRGMGNTSRLYLYDVGDITGSNDDVRALLGSRSGLGRDAGDLSKNA
jgi:hypothetical protein